MDELPVTVESSLFIRVHPLFQTIPDDSSAEFTMNPATSHSRSSVLTYAWWVVALLFPVALLNYLDRQMLATMKSSMVGDIPSISNKADWGLVLGCFKWTYAILSPFGGYVADRVSRRHVIGASL